jgi:hypothetical protein
LAVVSARFGALAWITAVPNATPVTGTGTLVAPAVKETLTGTVATPGLKELTPTVRPPAGAGPDRFNVRFCVVNPVIVRFCGEKLIVAVTCTGALPEVYPVAVAVTFAVPRLRPVTWGCVPGVVCPARMVTVPGETVTLEVSLLVSVIVTFEAACEGKVTARAADPPNPSVVLDGSVIAPALCTVTLAVAFGTFGTLVLAVMVVEPGATPVTATVVVFVFAAKVTEDGTVANAGLPEARLTIRPPAGAGAERFSARFCEEPALIVRLCGEKLMVAATCTVWLADV